jgi:ribosomal protein S27E
VRERGPFFISHQSQRENTTMSNFLDIRCPKCRATDQIDIAATVWLRVMEDGTAADRSEDGNHEFEPTSPATCNACGFTGRVQDFGQDD